MNQQLIDELNSNPDSILKKLPFIIENNTLKNQMKYKVSVPMNKGIGEAFGLDVESQTMSMIINEINRQTYKNITNSLLDTDKFDYVDFRNQNMNQYMMGQSIISKLDTNYKNIMTTPLLSNVLCDSAGFTPHYTAAVVDTSGLPSSIGTLKGLNVYIEPYMKYNDGRICFFNEVQINLNNFNCWEDQPSSMTFTPRLMIEYDVSYEVGDSKVLFVISDDTMDSYNEFLKLRRDVKIDEILNNGNESKDTL